MRFDNVSICSVAHVDATHRVSSAELERRLAETMKRPMANELSVQPGASSSPNP